MQFEIFEDAAMTFAEEFYSAIVDNYPVDAALSEARKAIFASNNDVEWGTPVLLMRTPDGILFKLESPEEIKPLKPTTLPEDIKSRGQPKDLPK